MHRDRVGAAPQRRLWIWALALTATFLYPRAAGAQDAPGGAVSLTAGVGWRGAGRIHECCGPYQSTADGFRSWWFAGSISRDVHPRLGLAVEGTWGREPRYDAYVQGRFVSGAYRGYASRNAVSSLTAAGLVRWRARRGTASTTVDLLGGAAWVRQRADSHLRTIVFRPTASSEPEAVIDITTVRHALAPTARIDVAHSAGEFAFVGLCRYSVVLGRDPERPDVDLGRHVLRIGGGVRLRF